MAEERLRFLFDADLKAVGRAIAHIRDDAAVIGDDRSGIPDTTDERWFPVAAERRLIVIRRDKDVLNPLSEERRLWEQYGLRGFVLAISRPASAWDEFHSLVEAWNNMEDHAFNKMRGERGWVARILRRRQVKPS